MRCGAVLLGGGAALGAGGGMGVAETSGGSGLTERAVVGFVRATEAGFARASTLTVAGKEEGSAGTRVEAIGGAADSSGGLGSAVGLGSAKVGAGGGDAGTAGAEVATAGRHVLQRHTRPAAVGSASTSVSKASQGRDRDAPGNGAVVIIDRKGAVVD
jgi:hypothetical protein